MSVAQGVVLLRREHRVEHAAGKHRAQEAEHIAHGEEALQRAQRHEAQQQEQPPAPPPGAPRCAQPEPRAQEGEGQMHDVIPTDRHVGGIERAGCQRQQRRRAQGARRGQPQLPAQEQKRRHAQEEPERVADDARQEEAVRKQEGERVEQVHVQRVHLGGIEPLRLHQMPAVGLLPREDHLGGHVAVEVDQIALPLQRHGQHQRQRAQRESQQHRPAPSRPLHRRPLPSHWITIYYIIICKPCQTEPIASKSTRWLGIS